jgi:predicted XRE-type DNA-binding protein
MGGATAHRQSQGGLIMNTRFENSSGNVFADLGLPNSEQELLKAKLTVQIYKLIKEQNLTQSKAAELLGTTQAQVSALMRCRPVSVSVGRLMEFLTILGQDVEVTVRPSPTRAVGHMSVVVQPN